MKLQLRLIAPILLIFSALTGLAGPPTQYFKEFSALREFDYNYVSPMMLRLMGNASLSASGMAANLPIKYTDLTSLENLSTTTQGQNNDLWKTIKQLKKDKNMETLTTKKNDNYRYDVLVTMAKDGKYILNLMLITQNTGLCVDVIYMEGKIPVESIRNSFY